MPHASHHLQELQKTAVRALFALSKDELALKASRSGGGVGAIFAAMAAHPDATQVLQEGTRALEKHCPRAVASIARLCGDLIAVLPPVVWSSGPDLGGMLQVRPLNLAQSATRAKGCKARHCLLSRGPHGRRGFEIEWLGAARSGSRGR